MSKVRRGGYVFVTWKGGHSPRHVIEQVIEYNQDRSYMRDLLLYRLTIEGQKRVAARSLSKREIIRRHGTSPAQFYRLMDSTDYRKSVDKLLVLLHVLDCEVDHHSTPLLRPAGF